MQQPKELKKYIIFSSCFFAFSTLTGYFFAHSNPVWAQESMNKIIEEFHSLIHPNSFIQFLIIFSHNAFASFLVIALFFTFGTAALFSIFSNGMMLGLVLNIYIKSAGLFSVIALLLPHGIIELPTFFFSSALGLWIGFKFAKSLSPRYTFKESFVVAIKLYFFLIIPLLFVAAIIETFVTPLIFEYTK